LATFNAGGNSQQESLSLALIGNPPRPPQPNVFTICNDTATARAEFNATVDTTTLNTEQKAAVKSQFSVCLNNAAVAANASSSLRTTQAQIASLQENSLTTNVKSEPAISTSSSEQENTDLNVLLDNPNVQALLANPNLKAMLKNPNENVLLQDPNIQALLASPEINALLADPNIQAKLANEINAQSEKGDVKAEVKNPTISALTGVVP
jgi:hypothetical protein